MPILDKQIIVCDHGKCENRQIVDRHSAQFAGWTFVNIVHHGADGLTVNNKEYELSYCPDHEEVVNKKLGLEVGG